MNLATVVATYKSLANVERDFRSLKASDLDLRPIHHHLETRVRAHVFLCMLAAHLIWHLRKAWAPLTLGIIVRLASRRSRTSGPRFVGHVILPCWVQYTVSTQKDR